VEAFRWIVCIGLGGFFGLILLGNWLSLIGTLWTRKSTSLVPLIGGLGCAVACLLCPDERVQSFAWLPLVLDLSISVALPMLMLDGLARLVGWRSLFDHEPKP